MISQSQPTALVSGVSRGLGRHISYALKDAGYRVLGVGMAPNPQNDAIDDYQIVDLRKPIAANLFLNQQIDVLINNAGVYLDDPRRGYGDLFSLCVQDLRNTFEVNLFGTFQFVLRYAPQMIARTSGRIVCVSSGMGRLQDADGSSFAYRSSKLAVNSMAVTVARHFESSAGDLSSFSYCPGWIRTEMGTESAPQNPESAAADLVQLLELPAACSNGKFFRRLDELGWDTPEPIEGDERLQRATQLVDADLVSATDDVTRKEVQL
ncbi:SDR family NAD(P)-dependent oxidoreductase [Nocardia goodfellowii]|uniref:NAD(P)-dependent dehydrogenase (Short-subunit alcohol dehydrogenase family) n=1 Tax=Nocardia goodfellowii TaxID=882446 RepID=A0ABS4QDC7_9NOCA|nr:SDR family NAD(P)-dependent oxidoreductase [Nocardia goodfellowii]MBP2189689.1 NAD(P)-dependent dehydrogenase (short-subunit alcohol dehydrogenase family) [Nocardia goodfellowii]